MSLPAQIHPRMPVILISFDDQSRLVNVKELLVLYPADQMQMWEISPRVNSPKNDDPSLWEALHADVLELLRC